MAVDTIENPGGATTALYLRGGGWCRRDIREMLGHQDRSRRRNGGRRHDARAVRLEVDSYIVIRAVIVACKYKHAETRCCCRCSRGHQVSFQHMRCHLRLIGLRASLESLADDVRCQRIENHQRHDGDDRERGTPRSAGMARQHQRTLRAAPGHRDRTRPLQHREHDRRGCEYHPPDQRNRAPAERDDEKTALNARSLSFPRFTSPATAVLACKARQCITIALCSSMRIISTSRLP